MKKLSYLIKAIALAAAVAVGVTSCQDDVDAPAVNHPEASVTPNTTIAELKEMFWNDATNYADTIRDLNDSTRRFIIHGRVISSDEQSNVYKSLVIQDETAALAFSIDTYNLYLNYRVGQEIVMDVTDMYIGKYAALQQIGRPSWYANGKTYQVSFMSLEYFQRHAELNGVPEAEKIDTLVVNSFADISPTAEGMRKWQSQLVRFKNVYFVDGGQKNFSVYHSSANEDQNRTIVDRNGGTMIVRTSGYASFAEDRIPTGNVDVVGILSYYNTAWQIILIDRQGIIEVGDVPGSQDKPYSVPDAIEDIKNNVSANGWVKGYIVGAVAPAVETVASNDDIEWTAPTVTSTTLVIAPSADTRNYEECLVVALPSESAFQQVGNLRDNPDNLGKEIMVKGNLVTYLGTYGLTGNTGKADEFSIDGVVVDGGEIADGDGSEERPYNCAQIIAKNPSSTTSAVETGVWVEGYIVGSMPTGGSSTTISSTNFSTVDAATTNLVIGPTADCTDVSKCVTVQLPSAMRSDLALANKPGNLGKRLAIKGDIMKYCGGPGVKNLTANKIDSTGGETPTPTPNPGDIADGDGQKDTPYNVAQIIAFNPTSKDEALQSGVWVKGYIVGSMPTGGNSTTLSGTNFSTVDAATTNLVLGPTPDCTDASQCIGIQLPSSMRSELALANKPENLGKVLEVKGDIMKYCGGPGIKNLTDKVFEGSTGGNVTPSNPQGEGTATSPYNVAKALEVSGALDAEGSVADVYVKGIITSVTEISTSFGNATYAIADAVGGETLGVYRGYWIDGEKFTAEDQLAVGAEVVVFGTLVNFYGNTRQLTTGSKVVTYTAPGSTGGNTGGNTDGNEGGSEGGSTGGETPETPSEDGAINVSAFEGIDGDATVTVGDYTFTFAKGTGTTKPKYYSNGMRLYKGNTLTISGSKLTEIVFTIANTAQYGPFTPSVGTLDPAQAVGDETLTWKGDASEVTFTVGDTADFAALDANKTKPAQFRFSKVVIK